MYNIEFIKKIEGRSEPGVLQTVNAVNSLSLDSVIHHAMGLPRPDGTEGFQIRENSGPVRHTTLFT